MILIKRLASPILTITVQRSYLTFMTQCRFAMMSLFEQPKKPAQLSPVFKKQGRLKGHLRHKGRKGYISPKLNLKVKDKPQKLKNHRGLLKRIKIVGPRWNRKFKRLSAENYHLKRRKSTQNLKRKARATYISKADMWRVKRMIPYFKRKSLKRMY